MRGTLKEITVGVTPAGMREALVVIRMLDPKTKEIDALTQSVGGQVQNVELKLDA
jgi:HAMP domain-containing protein